MGLTNNEALEYVIEYGKVNFNPEERFSYSNTGFIILAKLVEKETGKSLSAFCCDEIFQPLGMDNTFFVIDINQAPVDRAIGHTMTGEVFDYTQCTNGDGGMISTLDDMLIWYHGINTGEIVYQEVCKFFNGDTC